MGSCQNYGPFLGPYYPLRVLGFWDLEVLGLGLLWIKASRNL